MTCPGRLEEISFVAIMMVGLLGAVGCGDDSVSGDGSGTDSDTEGTDSAATLTDTTTGDPSTSTSMGTTVGSADTTGTADETGTADTGSTGGTMPTTGGGTTGASNTPPLATDDFYLTDTGIAQLAVDAASGVLANDVDDDGDVLTVVSFDATTEQGGTVVVQGDGSFTYTRPVDYWGEDRFNYEVDDGGGVTDTASVRIMTAPTGELLSTVAVGLVGVAIDGEVAGDQSGYSVAGGGDVDGDGLADVAVGANEATTTETTAGAGYIVWGSAAQAGDPIDLVEVAMGIDGFWMPGGQAGGLAGSSVEVVGDVNGDGLADLAVGAPQEDGGGVVYVVHGKADGNAEPLTTGVTGFLITAQAGSDALGHSVAPAGDVNGDGLPDIIVGALEGDGGRGMAAVIYGKTDADPVSLADLGAGSGLGFLITTTETNADLGNAVSGAGDVDGDGLDDVIVGAPAANSGGISNTGRAYVVLGKTDDANVSVQDIAAGTGGFVIDGAAGLDLTGHAVAGAGDVNGDGRADVLVGAHGVDVGGQDAVGRIYVVFGKNNTNAVPAADIAAGTGGFIIDGEAAFDFAGWSLASAGDVDGDGLADLVIGAHGAGVGVNLSNAGRAYVVYGKADTSAVALSEVSTGLGGFSLDGEASNDAAGWSVDGAGDVDGDGFADIVVGAHRADPGGLSNAGRSYVVYGGDYRGVTSGAQTPNADILYGTPQAETLVGGSGADELFGGGGADVLYGGPGDDVIVLPGATDFFRIDGGTGEDTLRLEGAGISLDLTNHFELAITGIERIDLTGNGDNDLFLELQDLRALSPTSNSLTVIGDVGDGLVADLAGAGFADLGSAGGFTTYGNGVLFLIVDDDLDAFVGL